MIKLEYKLFGFANGGGTAPQFLEPVFNDKNYSLFVQSCTDDSHPDEITEFIRFTDNVEVLENSSEEILTLGCLCLFAVRDVGDRVICGNRKYLAKYLRFNLNSYIDNPYFFKNACEFLKTQRPELKLFSSHSSTLESAVFSHSVQRFCDYEYKEKVFKSHNNTVISRKPQHYFDVFETNEEKTVFSRWLDFAKDDSPRLVKHSKWKDINKNYISLFDDECQVPNNAYVFFLIARSVLNDKEIDIKISEIKCKSSDRVSITKNIDKLTQTLLSENYSIDKFNINKAERRVSSQVASKIYSSLSKKKTSKLEITMLAYFLSLVSKRSGEISSTKDKDYWPTQ